MAGGKATLADLSGNNAITQAITDGLTQAGRNDNGTDQTPKAYINYMLFDEQFNVVKVGYSRVGNAGVVKDHFSDLQDIPVTKNGYLYVYTSNESPVNVYFDNLQVVHTRGPIVEETHYYPFGLTMAGISSKASEFGKPENKKKYNGIEFNDDLGLDTYEAYYRNLDPQTGRWWQIDPKIENMEMWSPYASMFGNPITNSDPLGDYPGQGDPPDKKWHAPMAAPQGKTTTINPFSPLIYQAQANIKADNVRTQYNKDAAKLDKADKQGRADLKEKARANTPEPFNSIVEKGRPMAGEQAKVNDANFKGNATKTNAEVNDVMTTNNRNLGENFCWCCGGSINHYSSNF